VRRERERWTRDGELTSFAAKLVCESDGCACTRGSVRRVSESSLCVCVCAGQRKRKLEEVKGRLPRSFMNIPEQMEQNMNRTDFPEF
jgi:hypothetical protein